MNWRVGQRVYMPGEQNLGLGIITRVSSENWIEVLFAQNATSLRFSKKSNPLRRWLAQSGDTILCKNGQSPIVANVQMIDYLAHYALTSGEIIPESEVGTTLSNTRAFDHITAQNIEDAGIFWIRKIIYDLQNRHRNNPTRGLWGSRVELLPHQMSIIEHLKEDEAIGLVLADEVGLGKSIEAALIFQWLRVRHQANKVLVVVPQTLCIQWISELYRRFYQVFTLIDQERIDEDKNSQGVNSFDLNNRSVIAQELFLENLEAQKDALNEKWDLVIVDEAHKLTQNGEYPMSDFVKKLSAQSKHLLLLSATPASIGENGLKDMARWIDPLGDSDIHSTLKPCFIRHERENVGGFKVRQPHWHEIDLELQNNPPTSALSKEAFAQLCEGSMLLQPSSELKEYNEALILKKTQILVELFMKHENEKFLVILRDYREVKVLEEYFKQNISFPFVVYHEGQSLVDRDKQAAAFVDSESLKFMLCSEIGGEGRNFQFVHHIVMWDLPLKISSLEQRIGRLDRIGQKNDIQIHYLLLKQTAQAALSLLYRNSLNSLCHPWNGMEPFEKNALFQRLVSFQKNHEPSIILNTKQSDALKSQIEKLLQKVLTAESHSTNAYGDILHQPSPFTGWKNIESMSMDEEQGEIMLTKIFAHFGVDFDVLSESKKIYSFSSENLMFTSDFPSMDKYRKQSLTTSRATALAREDLLFFSMDHPFCEDLCSFILNRAEGQFAMGQMKRLQIDFDSPFLIMLMTKIVKDASSESVKVRSFNSTLKDLELTDMDYQEIFEDTVHLNSDNATKLKEKLTSADFGERLSKLCQKFEDQSEEMVAICVIFDENLVS